jgi:hypothetical protein
MHYIYAEDIDIIEDIDTAGTYEPVSFVNPLTGEPMTVFNQTNAGVPTALLITNVDDLYRRYHGFEISTSKRLSNRATLGGSVVFSRTRSNISNTDGASDGFSNLYNDPNFNINIDGKPTYDPNLEVKITGIFELPYGIQTSFYYRHFTGDTWTPLIRIPSSVIDQGPIRIFGAPRGSERLPDRNVVDLRLQYGLPISTGDLLFTADFFNLFNTGYVYDIEDRSDRANFAEPVDFTDPRTIRLGVRYKF